LIDESPLRRAGDRDADGRDADLAAQVPAQPSTVSDGDAKAGSPYRMLEL
jgi:hypothetical protein